MFISFLRLGLGLYLTLKMASTQVFETSVTNNSPSQDSNHPGDLFQSTVILSSPVWGAETRGNFHTLNVHIFFCRTEADVNRKGLESFYDAY